MFFNSFVNASFSDNPSIFSAATFMTSIVPLALVDLHSRLENSKSTSVVINTVHDSVVIDVFPGEEKQVAKMMYDSMTQVSQKFEELYNVKWDVPLEVDLEIGTNWLNMKNYILT